MTGKQNPPPTAGEIGLMNLTGGGGGVNFAEQLADLLKQREIGRVMADVVRDVRYNPHPTSQAETPSPTKARNGWRDEEPIASPMGQDLIKAQCDAALPHGVGNPANPLAKVVEEALRKLKAGTQKAADGES